GIDRAVAGQRHTGAGAAAQALAADANGTAHAARERTRDREAAIAAAAADALRHHAHGIGPQGGGAAHVGQGYCPRRAANIAAATDADADGDLFGKGACDHAAAIAAAATDGLRHHRGGRILRGADIARVGEIDGAAGATAAAAAADAETQG